jgi:hypothetical protein
MRFAAFSCCSRLDGLSKMLPVARTDQLECPIRVSFYAERHWNAGIDFKDVELVQCAGLRSIKVLLRAL